MKEHFIPYDQTKEMIPVTPRWHPNTQFHYIRTDHDQKPYMLEWHDVYKYYYGKVNGLEGYIADAQSGLEGY